MKTGPALALLLIAGPAAAHAPAAGSSSTELWLILCLLLVALLYGTGLLRLWRRAGVGRRVAHWRAGCFAAGWVITLLALASSLHRWADDLLFIHMSEHELLMSAAAPLLVLGRPLGVFAWALPLRWRHALAGWQPGRVLSACWHRLTQPGTATAVHGAAIWIWHVPTLFDAAVLHEGVHVLQHLSFFVTALLFWSALFDDYRRQRALAAVLYLFVTAVHTSLLGALLVVSDRLWYLQRNPAAAVEWELTALEDQQLAGLIMWVPGGVVYAVAALWLFGLWLMRRPARQSWERDDAFPSN
ncbi:MAG TPA: cytochrome c oxidase assembly protein [Gammaproteobacteria bacterium]|nr:cytochrome c oxidase assembly protein [Gammaproteobacteria bacterium]